MSQLEEKVAELLQREKISYKREISIPFAKWKKNLRYDFGIFEGEKLIALIEVQGEQHYKFVSKFYQKEPDFERAKERDRQKIRAALANQIPLYIIPFCDISSLTVAEQLFQDSYLARSMWHNDTHNPYT